MTATRPASADWDACLAQLSDGMRTLGVRSSPATRAAMIEYLQQLAAWGRTYNLTAVRDPEAMVVRHLLDSLAAAPWLHGKSFVDIGAGAGLPGIPLALVQPKYSVALVESSRKKTAFMRHVLRALDLGSVEVVQKRCEDYAPGHRFDTVICRAFASAAQTVYLAGHLCAPGGRIVLMKGRDPSAELAELPGDFLVREVEAVTVPGLDAERHITVLEPGLI